jgi:hypothetical protein
VFRSLIAPSFVLLALVLNLALCSACPHPPLFVKCLILTWCCFCLFAAHSTTASRCHWPKASSLVKLKRNAQGKMACMLSFVELIAARCSSTSCPSFRVLLVLSLDSKPSQTSRASPQSIVQTATLLYRATRSFHDEQATNENKRMIPQHKKTHCRASSLFVAAATIKFKERKQVKR